MFKNKKFKITEIADPSFATGVLLYLKLAGHRRIASWIIKLKIMENEN